MSKPNFSAQLPDRTLAQIEALKPLFNGNKTQIVINAIDRMYQQETQTMKRQTAEQKVRESLKAIYTEGDIAAARVFKGFAFDTNQSGWHIQFFGCNDHVYLGNSVTDVGIFCDSVLSERETDPIGYMPFTPFGHEFCLLIK